GQPRRTGRGAARGDLAREGLLQTNLVAAERGVEDETTEVLLRGALDGDGGEKFGVEVARGEPEQRAVVAAHDRADVRRARVAHGMHHSRTAVVVRGDRERPAAEGLEVGLQMLGGGAGRA